MVPTIQWRGVHRIHTRGVHDEHYSHLTSTDYICACGSKLKNELQRHLCAHEKSLSSGQPCHLFAGLCLTFSLPVHHNTKHHLDSTTFSKTTLYTEHLFHNLYSRQAALMNRSRTSITRVAETCATPLPRFPKAQSLDQFLEVHTAKILDGFGIEVVIPSMANPMNTSHVGISRETKRFENETHDHKEELRSSHELLADFQGSGRSEFYEEER